MAWRWQKLPTTWLPLRTSMTIIVIQTMNTVSKVTAARTATARTATARTPGTMTRPGARSECTCSHLWREQMPTQTLTQVELPSFACHFTFPCLSFSTHFLSFLDPFAFLFMAPFHVFFAPLPVFLAPSSLTHHLCLSFLHCFACLPPPACLFSPSCLYFLHPLSSLYNPFLPVVFALTCLSLWVFTFPCLSFSIPCLFFSTPCLSFYTIFLFRWLWWPEWRSQTPAFQNSAFERHHKKKEAGSFGQQKEAHGEWRGRRAGKRRWTCTSWTLEEAGSWARWLQHSSFLEAGSLCWRPGILRARNTVPYIFICCECVSNSSLIAAHK